MQCRRPGCEEDAAEGRWCSSHGEFYARVRRELENADHMPRSIHRSCAFYACPEPRAPGSKLCLTHGREAE